MMLPLRRSPSTDGDYAVGGGGGRGRTAPCQARRPVLQRLPRVCKGRGSVAGWGSAGPATGAGRDFSGGNVQLPSAGVIRRPHGLGVPGRPKRVSVALGEIAADVRVGCLPVLSAWPGWWVTWSGLGSDDELGEVRWVGGEVVGEYDDHHVLFGDVPQDGSEAESGAAVAPQGELVVRPVGFDAESIAGVAWVVPLWGDHFPQCRWANESAVEQGVAEGGEITCCGHDGAG